MSRSIALVTLVVRDYDEAIAFFTEALRFAVTEDTPLGDGKRWVVVAPPDGRGAALQLAKAATPEQAAHVGDQTGGRVALFLHTDNFWDDTVPTAILTFPYLVATDVPALLHPPGLLSPICAQGCLLGRVVV